MKNVLFVVLIFCMFNSGVAVAGSSSSTSKKYSTTGNYAAFEKCRDRCWDKYWACEKRCGSGKSSCNEKCLVRRERCFDKCMKKYR